MENYKLTKTMHLGVDVERLFDSIADGTLFWLTGAKEVFFEFFEGSPFQLSFGEQGGIYGRLLRIERPNRMEFSWAVRGFGRADEHSTVSLRLSPLSSGASEIEICHENILSEQSLEAKTSAWEEILFELASSFNPAPLDVDPDTRVPRGDFPTDSA
jgi:hypothetical protein